MLLQTSVGSASASKVAWRCPSVILRKSNWNSALSSQEMGSSVLKLPRFRGLSWWLEDSGALELLVGCASAVSCWSGDDALDEAGALGDLRGMVFSLGSPV